MIAKGRQSLSEYDFLKGPSNTNNLQLNTLMEQSNDIFRSGWCALARGGVRAEEDRNDRDA